MTDDKRMDEIIEVADKISAAAEGHTNAAVLYALVNSLAMGVANTCRTQAEFEKSSDDVSAALRSAISGLGSKASEGITPLGASLIAIPYVVAGAKRAGLPRQALSIECCQAWTIGCTSDSRQDARRDCRSR